MWKTAGWWNAACALTALIRYTACTGDRSHAGAIGHTFARAGRRHEGFINKFYDDNGWWALAWVAAYDLTGSGRYLDAARAIFARNLTGWDGTCGGGTWWNTDRKYKNAVTNELFLTLAAALHQRAPGDGEYLRWALRSWEWLEGSGMIGPSGLVNDGLNAECRNNGGVTWTYNQGVILGGLAALHEITGDAACLRQGEIIADAVLRELATPAGTLAEPTEPAEPTESAGARRLDGDQTQFKGIFIRYLHEFAGRSERAPHYREFIRVNAEAVWDRARNRRDQFGARWGGPFDRADASRQSSALEVLTAAADLYGEKS
ncbi:MAG: glycoside hydrolase family 76 protein [Streptosporangiales bacterium]|nr:glycoside hydrolase family 76 protein [Streptosporangiales bacterium]